jgi:nitroreductase
VEHMDLDEAIRGRRSVRSYIDKSVSDELVRLVIEAGTFAPSAKNVGGIWVLLLGLVGLWRRLLL